MFDQWFDQGMRLAAEFGGSDDYLRNHRDAVLVALDFGLTPPDWPDYLDFLREE